MNQDTCFVIHLQSRGQSVSVLTDGELRLGITHSCEVLAEWTVSPIGQIKCTKTFKGFELPDQLEGEHYKPGKIIFLLTSRCNLSCPHCYSGTGRGQSPDVSQRIAEVVIDRMAHSLATAGRRRMRVGFHGGGEPFAAFQLMQKISNQAMKTGNDYGLTVNLQCITNGILTEDQVNWCIENLSRLSISLDGPQMIHDQQRPFAGDVGGSYSRIIKSIEVLESAKYEYQVRVTIHPDNIFRIDQIVRHLLTITSSALIKIELMTRWHSDGTLGPAGTSSEGLWYQFYKEVFGIRLYARSIGRKVISFDAAQLDGSYLQCGAWGDNMLIDGSDNVFSCHKATSQATSNNPFYIGSFTSRSQFAKAPCLKQLTSSVRNSCRFCFLSSDCGGGCIAMRSSPSSKQRKDYTARCSALRRAFIEHVIDFLDGQESQVL